MALYPKNTMSPLTGSNFGCAVTGPAMAPSEVDGALGIQGAVLDLRGQRALHQGEHFAVVLNDVGVRRVVFHPGDGWVAGQGVAENAEQRLAGLAFHLVLFRLHPAVAPGYATVLDVEAMDHAIAIKPVVHIRFARRMQRIWPIAIIGAGQVGGQFAFNDEIGSVALHAHGREIPLKKRIVRKRCGHDGLLIEPSAYHETRQPSTIVNVPITTSAEASTTRVTSGSRHALPG